MAKILNVFSRVLDVIMADGHKRLKFAIENMIYMAFAVVCAWGAFELISYVSESLATASGCACDNTGYVSLAICGIIICIAVGLYMLIAGIVSQAVLLIFALLGSLLSSTRGKNFLSFILALVSLAVCAVGALLIFRIIPI